MTDSTDSSWTSSSYKRVRRLRRKLREIEYLERCDRVLEQHERAKVEKKYTIRAELNELVEEHENSIREGDDIQEEAPYCDNSYATISVDEDDAVTTDCDIITVKRESGISEPFNLSSSHSPVTIATRAAVTKATAPVTIATASVTIATAPVNTVATASVTIATAPVTKATAPVTKSTPPVTIPSAPPFTTVDDPDTIATAPVAIATTSNKSRRDVTISPPSPNKRKIKAEPDVNVNESGDYENETDESKKQKLNKSDHLKNIRKHWNQAQVTLTCIEDHNDLVTCVIIDGDNIISGSRDTTIKVHSLSTCDVIHNMGGHKNTVTCIYLLNTQQSDFIADTEQDQCLVSGSLDCTIKLWSLKTGHQLKDIYTYDPITCMTYNCDNDVMILGSEGGKISAWYLQEGQLLGQCTPYSDKVSALQYKDGHVYSACVDGEVRVHRLTDQGDFECLFVSENIKNKSGTLVHLHEIHCLTLHDTHLFIGDDGANVKILDWKNGKVRKLSNNVGEFGATDAIYFNNDSQMMLSSAYDIDHGLGYINLRTCKGGNLHYITTLSSSDVGRITCLASLNDNTESNMFIVSGGEELILWKCSLSTNNSPNNVTIDSQTIIQPKHLATLARETAIESDAEGDDSDTEGEDDIRRDSRRLLLAEGESGDDRDKSWFSYCTIV